MKKIYICIIICVLLLGVGLGIYIFWNSHSPESAGTTSLADIQDTTSTQSGGLSIARALSLEKQKQLDQISEIYEVQESSHLTLIMTSFQKYKADFSLSDAQKVADLLQTHPSEESLQAQLQTLTGIKLLKNDISHLLTSYKNLQEEKELEQERLLLFQEAQKKEILAGNETLLEMGIRTSFEIFIASGGLVQTETLIQNILQSLKEPQNIFDAKIFNTPEKQKAFLELQLEKNIFESGLKESQRQELQNHIQETLQELEILLPENLQTGFFGKLPKLASNKIWDFFIGEIIYASEPATLTVQERAILLLKTQVQINILLQKSIDTEIAYNNGSISSAIEYSNQINKNLTAIEELLIFQESLQNDDTTISLDDIQRFNLASYVDDSQQIIDLTPIAYIEKKRGHAVVQNLNGSVKLAQETMLLYPGYSIETLAGAEVTIIFIDESLLRLEPQSKVSLKSGTDNLAVEVQSGSIWARVLKPLLSGEVLHIDTGDVSLAVAGTSIYVSASGSTKEVFIIDSYAPNMSGSVTMIQKTTGISQLLGAGKKIDIPQNATPQVKNQNKIQLLQTKNQLGKYIADDLSYLSLTLDDRKRGFYNSPLGVENNGQNFLGKLEGELQASIPIAGERSYIIKNPELSGVTLSTGSIYHMVQRDTLISQIKDSPNTAGQKSQKVTAITSIDLQNIQKELGSQRALENIFDYNIAQDIIDAGSMSPSSLESLFLNFDIQERENTAKILEEAKNKLTINNGSTIISRNIVLPKMLAISGKEILLDWKSSLPYILSSTGGVQNEALTGERKIILTATLSLGKLSTTKDFAVIITPRQLTEEEKLEKAGKILDIFIIEVAQKRFLNSLTYADTQQSILDFSGALVPDIIWSGSPYVNIDASTNRPNFSESIDPLDPLNPYIKTQVQAKLSHPAFPNISLTKLYNIQIKKKDETPQEMIARIASTAWERILEGNTYNIGAKKYFSGKTVSLPTTLTPTTVTYKIAGSGTLSGNIVTLIQSANTGSITMTPLITMVLEGTIYTGSLSPVSQTIFLPPSAEALALKELDVSRTQLQNFFANSKDILKTRNGQNIKMLDPKLSPVNGVTLQWVNFGTYLSSTGMISSPSFSVGDKTRTGSLKLSHGDTTTIYTLPNIVLNFKKLDETVSEKQTRLESIADAFWNNNYTDRILTAGKSIAFNKNAIDDITISYTATPATSEYYSFTSNTLSHRTSDCTVEKSVLMTATFSLSGVSPVTRQQAFTIPSKNGTLIGGECYELIASAQYDTPGDFKLIKADGTFINGPAININLSTCGTDTTGNCGWTSSGAIQTKYGYIASKISSFDKIRSWMTYDGESGILVDNEDTADSLSYDLSSLNLGTDWAIEMSVRGEDLKRNDGKVYTLMYPTELGVALKGYNGKIVLGTTSSSWLFTEGYNNIYLLKNGSNLKVLDKSNDIIISGTGTGVLKNLDIGNAFKTNQWNGIINSLKLYKKQL